MKKLILVIDDDYFVRSLLNFMLQDHYEVVTIENGFQAMLWLDKGHYPDLILTDIDMPKIDGFNLLKHLRKSGFYREIPVFVLTGHSCSDIEEKCRQSGATEFVTKPFNPPALLEKIHASLEKNPTDSKTDLKEVKHA